MARRMSIQAFSNPRNQMMVLVFLSLLPIAGLAQAPDVGWARQAGGTGSGSGRGIAVDRAGNSYVTGWFIGTAMFGGTTLASSGEGDIFVAKYDRVGNGLWAKR